MKQTNWLFMCATACISASLGAAPLSGAYSTDPQNEYTADQATREVKEPSQILCYISNTRPDAMVNKGRYVALIDTKKCDSDGMSNASNSTATGSAGATQYTPMSLTTTRASGTSPQIVKGHVDMKDDEGTFDLPVYIHMSQTEAPSTAAPSGVLTFNYAVKLNDATQINGVNMPSGSLIVRGRITTSSNSIQYAEIGGMGTGQTNDVRLYVSGNDSAGSGAVVADYNGNQSDATYIFGYNATNFCRSGTEAGAAIAERCFKRSKDDAIKSVWRYGVYNADGSRFDLPSPGFSVRDAAGNWGYASYWGLWLSNPPADGDTVTNAKSGTSYTVRRGGGKLIKTTRYQKKLDEIKNNKFQFYNMTAGSGLSAQTTYEAYWDAAAAKFKVVGTSSCGQNGCFNTTINTIEITAAQLLSNNAWGISGWSQSLGRVTVPATTLSDANPGTKANGVNYMAETVVKPGETVPANLKCVANCPTVAQINSFVASPSNQSPFDATTVNSWSGIANPIAYTWDASSYSLKDSSNAQVSSDLLANVNTSDFDKTNYKWGIRSGALVDAAKFVPGGDMDCDGQGGNNNYCDSKSFTLDEYYQYEIGAQDYNRATFLMSGSTPVSFSSPLTAVFDVPNDSSKYGLYAGASMNLQFLGFGDLNGIPGRCVDPYTNLEASCSNSTRWLPAFAIEDGSSVTIDGQTKYVKWLERELRFAPANGTAASLGITLGSTSNIPSAITTSSCTDANDTANPCNPSSDNYPGAFSKDDFKKAPSVIHGVVQQ